MPMVIATWLGRGSRQAARALYGPGEYSYPLLVMSRHDSQRGEVVE